MSTRAWKQGYVRTHKRLSTFQLMHLHSDLGAARSADIQGHPGVEQWLQSVRLHWSLGSGVLALHIAVGIRPCWEDEIIIPAAHDMYIRACVEFHSLVPRPFPHERGNASFAHSCGEGLGTRLTIDHAQIAHLRQSPMHDRILHIHFVVKCHYLQMARLFASH